MNKFEVVMLIAPLVIGYFSVSGERLVDLKVFVVWCAWAVLTASHIHSIHLLSTNKLMEFWIRYAALNISAVGLLVLFGVALFFKKYLREEFMRRA